MSFSRVGAVTRRVIQQFRRDRRTLALLFGVPLIVLTLFWYLLRGGGGHTPVGVVDLDQGPLGARVTQSIVGSTRVDASQMDQPTAEQRLRDDRIGGYVLFPSDFSARAQAGTISPEIHLEGSQPSQNADVIQAVDAGLQGALGSAGPHVSPAVTYLHGGANLDTLDYFGAAFLGLIVFFLVFVITSVSFLRERSQGTLERLMASPLRRAEIVLGYMLGFGAMALIQSVLVLVYALYVLGVHNEGNVFLVFLIQSLLAIGAVNLGIFLSMFARTEFQAVQFIPLVLVPQVLLSGIVFPIGSEPVPLQYVSNLLPLTYAVYGMRDVMLKGAGLGSGDLLIDIGVGVLFAVLMILLASTTLPRRVA
ncbi:MAG TPA: ABC transporter permease [Candidatus Dormibacteraeota bacterium]|nr:ABC transporter permease [Candidatus Dormibacteraeota bacterium]